MRFLSRSAFWFNLEGLRPWLYPYVVTTLNFQAVSGVQLLLLWCLVLFGTRLYAYCGPVALLLWSVLVLAIGFASAARLLHTLAIAFCWIYPASGCGFLMVPWMVLAGTPPMSGWFCLFDHCQPCFLLTYSMCAHIGAITLPFTTFIYSIAYISAYLSSLF